MKTLVGSTVALVAGILTASMFFQNARADTFTISQNDADYSDTPGTPPGTIAYPTSPVTAPLTTITGTVYNGTLMGSESSEFRSPYENYAPPNTCTGTCANLAYSSVQADSSGSYTFTSSNTLTILWGSPDSYNTLEFLNSGAGVGSFTGSDLLIQTYGHDLVTFTDTSGTFNEVILSSGSNAFEFSELAASNTNLAPTPLPGALPLFATGIGALGLLGFRRKRKNHSLRVAAA